MTLRNKTDASDMHGAGLLLCFTVAKLNLLASPRFLPRLMSFHQNSLFVSKKKFWHLQEEDQLSPKFYVISSPLFYAPV